MPAKVLVPLTVKLEVVLPVTVMAAVPDMVKAAMIWEFCKFRLALEAIATVPSVVLPKLPLSVTVKVPALIVVPPL